MKVIITGGGTGGHIYPALAIAEGLKDRYKKVDLLYIGDSEGMEADIVSKTDIPLISIPLNGFSRNKFSPQNIKTIFQAIKGFFSALGIIRKFKPDLIVGTGGYVCGPIIMAAVCLHVPSVIHEQNAFPGITNKILSRFVDLVLVTFEDSIDRFPKKDNIRVTGLPIRQQIKQLALNDNISRFRNDIIIDNDDKALPNVLCVGGSLGAESLNSAMCEIIERELLAPRICIHLATGRNAYPSINDRFKKWHNEDGSYGSGHNVLIDPFIFDMVNAFKQTDLIICRAGAATMAEITAVGIPAIIVPYPLATENHQEFNAESLADKGAAVIIRDNEINAERLYSEISQLLNDRDRLLQMRINSKKSGKIHALDDILTYIDELLIKSNRCDIIDNKD